MITNYFVIYLGHLNIKLSFSYRPSLEFKAKVHALFFNAYEYPTQTLHLVTLKIILIIIEFFK